MLIFLILKFKEPYSQKRWQVECVILFYCSMLTRGLGPGLAQVLFGFVGLKLNRTFNVRKPDQIICLGLVGLVWSGLILILTWKCERDKWFATIVFHSWVMCLIIFSFGIVCKFWKYNVKFLDLFSIFFLTIFNQFFF